MRERPLWRWWLFCFTLWFNWGRRWKWLDRLYSWSILPEWVATPEEIARAREGGQICARPGCGHPARKHTGAHGSCCEVVYEGAMSPSGASYCGCSGFVWFPEVRP